MSICYETPLPSAAFVQGEECIKTLRGKCRVSFVVNDLGKVSDRPILFELYRKFMLDNDHIGLQLARNLILQNYVRHKHYILADKFMSAVLPQECMDDATNSVSWAMLPKLLDENETACFFLHAALVKTVLVDYNTAKNYIANSIRKGPGDSCPEFHQYISKLSVLIELLNGGTPAIGDSAEKPEIRPYTELADCIRRGEVSKFEEVLKTNATVFEADRTILLATRVRHNVLRTALRAICRSYSRISLTDVAEKLCLDEEATRNIHYILMKAISEGAIAAKIDFSRHELISTEFTSLYSTIKPFSELQSKIEDNKLFQQQVAQAYSAACSPRDNEALKQEEEALKKKIDEANQELVKALEDGVDSDASEWMD
ncbi:26S proteasome non-atpase regulatory subunit 3 [Perkinsela sp. CCAP 1560/4]|nr:26S proteasome non-atpase regulatory subunit 3 [Perkinsela sp. CCAP 1560/4]|eukprot:KNH04460.1 26S proteasome non-atpase regulatory subunit 3 [Perkinsela sp. CCAP 1560/4]